MARDRIRFRKGRQEKEKDVPPFEDIPYVPSSWPPEIPVDMTHGFRVSPPPGKDDKDLSIFASTGPLEMFEHTFQLEGFDDSNTSASTSEDDCSEPSHSQDDDDDDKNDVPLGMHYDLAGHINPDVFLPAAYFRANRLAPGGLESRWDPHAQPTPFLDNWAGTRASPCEHDPRWWHGFSMADSGYAMSRPPSPDASGSSVSFSMSRRSSLAMTELDTSRASSPSVSSSQNSSLSSIEVSHFAPPSEPLQVRRSASLDNASAFTLSLLPQHLQHQPQNAHAQHPSPYKQPTFPSCPDLGTMRRPSQPPYAQHPDALPKISPSASEMANRATATQARRFVDLPAGVARQGQAGPNPGLEYVPYGCQQDSQRRHQLSSVSNLPHVGPWSGPPAFGSRTLHSGTFGDWRFRPTAGSYPQFLTSAPSQAFKDFMADLGHTVPQSTSLTRPLLPPVHVPPIQPMRPQRLGFPVPLRHPFRQPYAPKERDWTAHFEALGRKGRKKKSSRRKKGQPEEAKKPETYQCPMCDRDFERRNGLAIHMKWHYREREGEPFRAALFERR